MWSFVSRGHWRRKAASHPGSGRCILLFLALASWSMRGVCVCMCVCVCVCEPSVMLSTSCAPEHAVSWRSRRLGLDPVTTLLRPSWWDTVCSRPHAHSGIPTLSACLPISFGLHVPWRAISWNSPDVGTMHLRPHTCSAIPTLFEYLASQQMSLPSNGLQPHFIKWGLKPSFWEGPSFQVCPSSALKDPFKFFDVFIVTLLSLLNNSLY